MDFAGIGHNRQPLGKRCPDCYCHTCAREIHHLGIMSHRAAHRRRKEYCEITFSTGETCSYNFDT
jgi:hypothetical protein